MGRVAVSLAIVTVLYLISTRHVASIVKYAQRDLWPFYLARWCGSEQPHEPIMMVYYYFWLYVFLFYGLAALHRYILGSWISKSTVSKENHPFVFATHGYSTFNALVCTVLGLRAMAMYAFKWPMTPEALYYLDHVDTDPISTEVKGYCADMAPYFCGYIIADLCVGLRHNLLDMETTAHHIIFTALTIILRLNCLLPGPGVVLLFMEVSTPFLNVYLYFRHRPGWGHESKFMLVNFMCFLVSFLFSRVVIYGIMLGAFLCHFIPGDHDLRVQTPTAVVIVSCMILGWFLQCYWAWNIFGKAYRWAKQQKSSIKSE